MTIFSNDRTSSHTLQDLQVAKEQREVREYKEMANLVTIIVGSVIAIWVVYRFAWPYIRHAGQIGMRTFSLFPYWLAAKERELRPPKD